MKTTFLLYSCSSFVHVKFFKFSLSKITKPNNNFVLKSRGTGDRIGYLVIAGSAGGYFFGKRKGNLFFLSPFLSFSRHGVLMVIQSMRFIDNGRTVPQVLKASPPLSTLSSSPRSRGMHPIIGTLSVSLRGDNDALPPIQPPPSLFLSSFLHPNYRFPLPALGSQSLAKNLIYPLCSALPGERRAGRERERGGGGRERESERDRWNRARKRTKRRERQKKEKGRIYFCSRFLARAGYALRRSCKTCLLRRIPVFSSPSFSPLFFSARSLPPRIGGRAE